MSGHEVGPEHAEDRLSGYLDGELAPDAHDWVVAHLADCPDCADAAEALAATRTMLRGLPPLGGSPVAGAFIARHRRLVRAGATFVGAASVILGLLALTAAVSHPRVAPDLDQMLAAHLGAGSPPGARAVDDLSGLYSAPAMLTGDGIDHHRMATFDGADMVAVHYGSARAAGSAGEVSVSVFEQPGRLDWDRLPDGDRGVLDGRSVWWSASEPHVAVAQRGHLVVTVISADRATVLAALGSMPDRRRSATWDRVHDACQRYLSVFAFGG